MVTQQRLSCKTDDDHTAESPRSRRTKSVVGDLVNFRGLVYAPVEENGVIFLFGKVAQDLNMYVEEIKKTCPDCIARRFTGKGWERVRVEFEFRSSQFKQHGHDPDSCDLIVCWEHDWEACPIEVIELRERIKEFENFPIERPGETQTSGDIEKWFQKGRMTDGVAALFEVLWNHVRKKNGEAFYKVGDRTVGFYSPERSFMRLHPRRTKLHMHLFTGGRRLGRVKQFDLEHGAEKWGAISIGSQAQLKAALPWIVESMQRIQEAVKKNEPTGWYAVVESDDEG